MSNAAQHMPAQNNHLRLVQLLAMSKRLAEAIALDIAALEQGRFADLKTADPEIERLCALYGREVKALKANGGTKGAPAELIAELKETGARLNGLLARHGRLVFCMRQAAEGLVHAVAKEVEKTREQTAPYVATPQARRSSGGAIVYSKLV